MADKFLDKLQTALRSRDPSHAPPPDLGHGGDANLTDLPQPLTPNGPTSSPTDNPNLHTDPEFAGFARWGMDTDLFGDAAARESRRKNR